MSVYFLAVLLLSVVSSALAQNALPQNANAGILDSPLPAVFGEMPGKPGVSSLSLHPATVVDNVAVTALAELRKEVVKEQAVLENLDQSRLQQKAEQGDRLAQVVLGVEFAKEATLLLFAPKAANDALSDAARWYSLAASGGFPGAPSLDQAGIRFYPIRMQRQTSR